MFEMAVLRVGSLMNYDYSDFVLMISGLHYHEGQLDTEGGFTKCIGYLMSEWSHSKHSWKSITTVNVWHIICHSYCLTKVIVTVNLNPHI